MLTKLIWTHLNAICNAGVGFWWALMLTLAFGISIGLWAAGMRPFVFALTTAITFMVATVLLLTFIAFFFD